LKFFTDIKIALTTFFSKDYSMYINRFVTKAYQLLCLYNCATKKQFSAGATLYKLL